MKNIHGGPAVNPCTQGPEFGATPLRGRPRNTWRRDLDADVKRSGHTWGQLENLAQDRDAWRALVRGLCPRLGDRRK